jgi:tetratricopeptide (TPR) repeat protein
MSDPAASDMNDALSRVLASEEFAASPRLRDFLAWVVQHWVDGTESRISGKAIAVDIYGRDAAEDDPGLNLVRVEARRLRRRLDRYYDHEGQDDPWRIHIDKGGYAPRFEKVERDDAAPVRSRPRFSLVVVAAGVAAVAALVFVIEHQVLHSEEPESRAAAAERSAIGSRSMVSLQAVNLAEQAQNLLFPVFDIRQQEIALEMFQRVIELDPGLHHGYSGAAQVLGVLAFLEPDESRRQQLANEAVQMASAGVDRAPTDAWAIAARGWTTAVSGSMDGAMEQARLAVDIAPENGHVLDLAGITAIAAGDGEFAAAVSDPARDRSSVARFGANNIWGVSQIMTGNYPAAVEAFSGAAEAGASISAPSLVFLAVACDHVGRSDDAEEAVRELRNSWPSFPLEFVVGRMFASQPAVAEDILARIAKYDYAAPLATR